MKFPPPWFVAAFHGPCQVSDWKKRPFGFGVMGLKVLEAEKLKLGVRLVLKFPAVRIY